jgi:hypothetical protein
MCLVLLLFGLLTACGTPLVTNRRTPSPPRTITTIAEDPGASGTSAPGEDAPTVEALDATATVAPPDATGAPPIGGTEIAEVPPPTDVIAPTEVVADTTEVAVNPTQSGVVIIPATPAPVSYNDRWRQQQLNREPFAAPRTYITTGSELFWYDPIYQQPVLLGTFTGPFEVLATFDLRSTGQPALEVLYQVNRRYGLTALSPAIVERIEAAGYTDGVIDTYVIVDDNVRPR